MEENNREANKSNEGTITLNKSSLWKIGTFVFAALFVISLFTGGFGFDGIGGGVPGTGNVFAPTPTPAPTPGKVTASVNDEAMMGNKNAEVTIIEFSDYQCPFCGRHAQQTFPQIKSQYIDTGKVNLVFRDFPLTSIHPQAVPAAIAAECVREKGGDEAYFEYHDVLFANQQVLNADNYKKWAQEMGYDIGSCVDSGKYASEVAKDTSDATASGGQGTPYFVIMNKDGEGIGISGAQPFSAFQQAIESLL